MRSKENFKRGMKTWLKQYVDFNLVARGRIRGAWSQDLADPLDSGSRGHFWWVGAVINCRTHRPQVGGMDFTDEPIVEGDAPAILPPRFEPDVLPDESFADKTTATLPISLSIGPHLPDGPATRVAVADAPHDKAAGSGNRLARAGSGRGLHAGALRCNRAASFETAAVGRAAWPRVDGWCPL